MKDAPWLKIFITILRIAVGWHLLYEGLVKLADPGWTSYGYLINTSGFLSPFYHWIATNPGLLGVVDILNMYGLVLIGLGLFTGFLVRYAAAAGALLLALYYFAYPPFGGSLLWSSDGSLYVVDRILIETIIMMVFVFSKERGYGIDGLKPLLFGRKMLPDTTIDSGPTSHYSEAPGDAPATSNKLKPQAVSSVQTRREVLKNLVTLPVLGVLGLSAFRIKEKFGVDVLSGATIQVNAAALGELKGTLPKGQIGNIQMSRLVLGGNLIGGWAHSRDLIYVSSLFRAYNTEKKIYETLMLAENAGVDTINIGFVSNPLMAKYKKMTGSKIKVISQVAPNMEKGDIYEQINGAIDNGADIIQVQGNWCDWLVRDKKFDVIDDMLTSMRSQGYIAGLGAHTVDALIACEEQGIIPDYYMQTMHHDNYWSAHPRENRVPFEVDGERHLDHNRFHDNIFCLFPDKTVEFVNRTTIPVMGFKVLAAGSITPEDGFRWAFENGADFICVGMFDFQIVKDVNITIDTLEQLQNRQRAWFA